ncbi:FAD-binding-3 domain-containing protein [Mycena venus]|uniref:FAD-binding-3 domain-containing protein n=1 Tax=Mycena venus TaxID=2733690 RepID=A0A8H6XK75_9AGAR|nr:FAD-binding-3 domain-containing protein [Mycena venus]
MPTKKKDPAPKPQPPCIDEFADLCAALDASGRLCNAKTKEDSRWCPRHDEERIKLYINYKAHHTALNAFPEHSICHSAGAIKGCTSLETIRAWNKALLTKYQLLNRCISARAYFTERFFGCVYFVSSESSFNDFGHKTFWHALVKQLYKIEALLSDVEQRACALLLEGQNALWVLELQADQSESPQEECSGHDDAVLSATSSKPRPGPTDVADVEDPLDVALREKCNLLWEKIKTRLARYCAPPKSKFYNERINVIHACVRRAIYTDAKLLVVAQNYNTVVGLLTDTTLDMQIVEKLWHAIRHLYVHEVRAAIDDVLRPRDGTGEFVTVLGGRVYKDLSSISFPFHAWGHMTALFQCYSCVRRVCKTVDEIVTLTRFVVLNMSGLSQSNLRYEIPYEGSKVLSLCGFIPNSIDTFPPRSVVSKCNCVYNGVPHWEETSVSYVLAAGLSLTDPKAAVFVNACLRDPSLMVIVRKGATGRIIKSAERVWAERMRSANTRAGLRSAKWDPKRTVYYQDSVLEEACPRVSATTETEALEECFQLVLVDGGEGSMADFVKKVSDIWLEKVYKVADTTELIWVIAMPIVRSGELEINYRGKRGPAVVVASLETDVLAAYKRLWGKAPAELVDDDIFERIPGPLPRPRK